MVRESTRASRVELGSQGPGSTEVRAGAATFAAGFPAGALTVAAGLPRTDRAVAALGAESQRGTNPPRIRIPAERAWKATTRRFIGSPGASMCPGACEDRGVGAAYEYTP